MIVECLECSRVFNEHSHFCKDCLRWYDRKYTLKDIQQIVQEYSPSGHLLSVASEADGKQPPHSF